MRNPHCEGLNWKFPPLKVGPKGNSILFEKWSKREMMRFAYICNRLYGKNIRGAITHILLEDARKNK